MSLVDQSSSPACATDLYGHACRLVQPHLFMPGFLRAVGFHLRTRSSSGPWLRLRLFCPVASSLTMATSESLTPRHGLLFIPWRRRALPSSARASPIYSACPSTRAVCRTPAVLETSADYSVPFPVLLSSNADGFSNRLYSDLFRSGPADIGAAQFALCCGPRLCLPCHGQDFYDRAFAASVTTVRRRLWLDEE